VQPLLERKNVQRAQRRKKCFEGTPTTEDEQMVITQQGNAMVAVVAQRKAHLKKK